MRGWQDACRTTETAAPRLSIAYLPATLDQLAGPFAGPFIPDAWQEPDYPLWVANFMRESLLDYVVATYGREAIGKLFAGFGEHESWETLVPAVLDIPAEELETEWQQFLLAGGCTKSGGTFPCK